MAAIRPPAYSSDELPDYSQSTQLKRSPAYSSLSLALTESRSPTNYLRPELPLGITQGERYVFGSKYLTLDLGERRWATYLPTYERNALVKGSVRIKTFKHVDHVELALTGIALTYMTTNGTPSLRSSKVVLSEKSTIWSSDLSSASGQRPNAYSFSFALPDYAIGSGPEDETTTLLPPSASITTRTAKGHVFYLLKVDMFRRGMWFHDSVQTEILYLPRTVSRYERPYIPLPASEKPRRICDLEWRTFPVPLKHSHPAKPEAVSTSFSNVDVHLSLPHKLRYPSGSSVPFAVTLSGPGLTCANLSQLTAGLKISLVKTSTAVIRGTVSKSETELSVGWVRRIDEDERHWQTPKPRDSMRQVVIRGCLGTGAGGRDQSWGVEDFADVSYQVRLQLAPSQVDKLSVWELDETVVITSHEWDGSGPWSMPALGLAAAARTPMSIHMLNLLHRVPEINSVVILYPS